MQDLYPIIRRKRRPLVMTDAPPVDIGSVEPVNVVASLARTTMETEVESPRSVERKEEAD